MIVTGGRAHRIAWGEWGEAVMLELAYKHPRTGKLIQIRQAVRIARHEPFELRVQKRAQLVCWGVMPSGMLTSGRRVRGTDHRATRPDLCAGKAR